MNSGNGYGRRRRRPRRGGRPQGQRQQHRSSPRHNDGRSGGRSEFSERPRSRAVALRPGVFTSFFQALKRPFTKLSQSSLKVRGEIVSIHPDLYEDADYIPPLFSSFPELIGRIPWVSLRACEKPSHPKRISRAQHLFGNNYAYIKRESRDMDLIVESEAKKLEFILGQSLTAAPQEIVYFGSFDSKRSLALAQACSILKKELRVYLLDRAGAAQSDPAALEELKGLRSLGFKVKIIRAPWYFQWLNRWEHLRAQWRKIHFLPVENELVLEALAYVSSLLELRAYQDNGLMAAPNYLFVPVDSGASLVGMEVGKRLLGWNMVQILGVTSEHSVLQSSDELVRLAKELTGFLNAHLNQKIPEGYSQSDFQLIHTKLNPKAESHLGREELIRWSSRFLELEGIELDLEFSAPALRASCEFVKEKSLEGKRILFWNSYSGKKLFDLGGSEFFEIQDRVRRQKFFRRAAQ